MAMDGDGVAGVGIIALDTVRLFGTIKRRYWHRLLWPVVKQVVRHPALIGQLVQSLRYPNTLKPLPDEAEVLFFGLRHTYMRLGIGPHMLDHLLDETYRRGAPRLSATIEKRNRPVRWMIANRPGVRVDQEIVLNGKTMLVYRAELPLGVDRPPPTP
jgi:GNAT superfamily N-acetyltransferase